MRLAEAKAKNRETDFDKLAPKEAVSCSTEGTLLLLPLCAIVSAERLDADSA